MIRHVTFGYLICMMSSCHKSDSAKLLVGGKEHLIAAVGGKSGN